ncbi:MAG: outer rane adhesin like protein [Bacteroidetes bacterium]|nr:outer rane adhesin like protein [Bacteroidota bacterium]
MTKFSPAHRCILFALFMATALMASAQNVAPVAVNDTTITPENTPASGTTATNDSDIDGPAANYTQASNPLHGIVVVNADGTYTYTPATYYNGVDSFWYSLCDGGTPDLCDTATVVITITAVNNPPIVFNDFDTTTEEVPTSGTVLTAGENDPDGTFLGAGSVPVRDASHGSLLVNTDGTYFYTPDVNFAGNDTIVIAICDGGIPLPPACSNDTLIITVTPVNDAPTVINDANTTNEDTPVSGTVITAGDSDPDGTTMTANTTPVSGPSNGTIVVNANGTYTYTPAANFSGTDTVVIIVCDGGTPLPAICKNDTLIITVTPVNDPPVVINDVNTTNEDTPVSGNILPGDSDPEGTALRTITAPVLAPIHGTLFINTSGAYTYIPAANFNGTDIIVISVCDNGLPLPAACSNDTLTITVNPVNDAPVAVNDTASTLQGSAVSSSVSGNDSDIDGPAANFTLANGPSHGTVVFNGTGTYTYTPTGNYNGADTFTYSLCDGGTPDLCDTAMVVLTIDALNNRPDAVNDTVSTLEDTPINGSVATNDTDSDGPSALFGVDVRPAHGTVNLGVNGTYTYTPAANFSGTDSFTYVYCDGGLPNLCDTATVYITTAAVNDAPVANDDNANTLVNTQISGTVATNDSDVDGPSATYTVVSTPAHGVLVLTDSGTYVYTPITDYIGCDTMLVSLCDGGTPNMCDTSALVVCVTTTNQPPVALDDIVQVKPNTSVIINVLDNDDDPDGNLTIALTVLNNPSNGSLVDNGNGTLTYTPDANYEGADTFSYIICDGGTPVYCDTANVYITVAYPLTITGAPMVTQADSAVSACFSYTSNVDSSLIALILCQGQHGVATIVALDSTIHQICITYTPDSNYTGPDSFCVTLCTGGNTCTTATIPVTVNAKNATCYWLKGISPNGDGQNDDFYVNCNDTYPDATLKVFNRWGDQVWDSNGHYTNNWEGKNGRGEVLPDGTYFYIYYYNDGSKGQHGGFIQVSR